jgi:hypothetical protein
VTDAIYPGVQTCLAQSGRGALSKALAFQAD